jgi:two-component system sensor histidine kinase YesM
MNNVFTYNKSTLNLLAEELNVFFNRCMELGSMIESDSLIQRRLRNPLPEDKKTRYLEELELSETLSFIHRYTVKDVFGIYVIGINGGKYQSNSLAFQKESFIEDSFLEETISQGLQTWKHTEGRSIAVKVIDDNFIAFIRPINNKLTGNVIGIAIIEIETRVLQRYIDSAELLANGNIFLMDDSQILYYIGDSRLIIHGDEFTGPKRNRKMYLAMPADEKYMFDSQTTISGMTVMSAVSLQNIRRQSFAIISVLIITIVIVLIFFLFIDYSISVLVTKPIRELSEKMNLVEKGDLDIRLEPRYKNEIGKLVVSFNTMVEKTKGLMEKIISDQHRYNKLRYEILQEQIKPHFLYNTLDSAIWLSRDNQNGKVIELITSLVAMMRLSLNSGSDIITIKEEAHHIKSYLSILKIRYSEKLNYTIEIPETTHEFIIPKLTLQPFVENAVYHGIKNKADGGSVNIWCIKEGGHLHFFIRDTGVGIEEEELAELNNLMKSNKKTGIGIRNVMERLMLHFGEEAKVKFEKTANAGTTVHIIIPQLKEKGHGNY